MFHQVSYWLFYWPHHNKQAVICDLYREHFSTTRAPHQFSETPSEGRFLSIFIWGEKNICRCRNRQYYPLHNTAYFIPLIKFSLFLFYNSIWFKWWNRSKRLFLFPYVNIFAPLKYRVCFFKHEVNPSADQTMSETQDLDHMIDHLFLSQH